jgi:hypothetical protein
LLVAILFTARDSYARYLYTQYRRHLKIELNRNLFTIMENNDGHNWDAILDEALNEESSDIVIDTTIRNPGDDILSESDITALETWVKENSTMDMDASDGPQDLGQSSLNKRLYEPRESLSALGSSMSFDSLASEMELLKQT